MAGHFSGWQIALRPDGGHQRLDADDVHDAGEIVGQNVQCHLGCDLWQRLHQEVGRTHPSLDRSEWMLNRLPPLLHGFEHMLMLPSRDPSLRPGGALRLERAIRARRRPVASQLFSILLVRVSVREAFAGRAAINVLIGQIDKVLLAEAALRLGAPEVIGFGSVTVIPASWQTRISGLLK
jgi:hypothetical protein